MRASLALALALATLVAGQPKPDEDTKGTRRLEEAFIAQECAARRPRLRHVPHCCLYCDCRPHLLNPHRRVQILNCGTLWQNAACRDSLYCDR